MTPLLQAATPSGTKRNPTVPSRPIGDGKSVCEFPWHVGLSACRDGVMTMIAVISHKDGAGKMTLALHLAAAAQEAGLIALVIDTDPQATTSQWAAWRQDAPLKVIASPRLAAKVAAART